MLLGKEDKITGHSPARLTEVAEAHMCAYQYDDMDRLMATVSPRGGIWSGLLPPTGAVIMRTPAQIREAYGHALAAVRIGEPQSYIAVASDWYVIVEGITTITEKASGRAFDMAGLGIYGADDLGLAMDTDIGSIMLSNRPCPANVSIERRRLTDYQAHRSRLDAMSAGNLEGALAGVGEPLDLFLPCFDPDEPALQTHAGSRDAYRTYLKRFFSRFRVERSRELNRLTTSSWVFSELEWSLADLQKGTSTNVRFALCEALDAAGAVRGGIGVAVRA